MLRPHHALGTFDDNVIRVLWVRPDLHNALAARGLHAKGPYLRRVVRPVLPLLGVEPHSLRNHLAASTEAVVGHLKPHDETGLLLLLGLREDVILVEPRHVDVHDDRVLIVFLRGTWDCERVRY